MNETGSYAQAHGQKYHPIAVETIKRMADEGLSINDAKEIIHEIECLLGTAKLFLGCFLEIYDGIEDSIKDTIGPVLSE